MSLPARFLLREATARPCELDGAPPSKQALGCWNLTFQSWVLTPKVTSLERKLDILASVRGERLIKYPLETKSSSGGKGVVTSALLTPGRHLGVEVCSTITLKK